MSDTEKTENVEAVPQDTKKPTVVTLETEMTKYKV